MTGKDLVVAMSGIEGRYIEEAAPAAAPQRRSLRRPLLIAAAIAVALLLVGCGIVYALRLQDMSIGKETYTQRFDDKGKAIDPVEKSLDIITPYGRSGDAIHTDITRLGRKIFDLDLEIGDYNDPQTAPQIFGDTSKPQDGMQYFYKYEMGQDENARIFVENLRLLSYRGVMDFSTWENAGITQISSEPSDSDPWAMFPVVKPLGGGWTNLSINLLGVKKTTPIEATDEIVGKLILGKYDSPQIGRPTRMF